MDDKYAPKPKLTKPKAIWLDEETVAAWERLKAKGYVVSEIARDAIKEKLSAFAEAPDRAS